MAIETKQLLNLSQIYRDRIAKESVLQEKKAAKDYDGDGKVESGKDEYFGSKDKAIKKAMGKSPVAIEKKERKKDELFGAPKTPKTKKESFSNWRKDLQEVPDYEQIPISAKDRNKKIEEKNVKNTIKINPEMKEGVEIISEKEVDVKDTRRTVDAIRAYDRSKDASRDATYDTDHGKKGKAKKEKEYAKKERGEIDKDDPNWKKKKYHTGMHGESYEATKTKEVMAALKKKKLKDKVKKKIAADIVKRKGDTSKSDDRYAYESYGGEPIQGEGTKGKTKKEIKDLKKAAETGKGKYVAKADKVES